MLINPFMDMVILFISVRWRPHFRFSISRFKDLFNYGWKVLVSGVLDTTYEEVRGLIIAKEYSSADLSFYSKGKRFPSLIGTNVASTISSVLFPVFSLKQDSIPELKNMVRRSMNLECYYICPVMVGLAAVAESFVRLLLTEKWLPCVPFIYIFCAFYLFKPLKNLSQCSIIALKRSDLDLIANVIEKVTGIGFILLTFSRGPVFLALSALLSYIIAAVFNMVINRKLIDYRFREQLQDILPAFVISLISCAPAFFLNYLSINAALLLLIQILSSICIYIGLSHLLKMKAYLYTIKTIKEYLAKRKRKITETKNG